MNKLITQVKDIRFFIVVLFLIRLVGITNPPLEVSHNWRQTTVTMPARNFLEIDNTIYLPRIDFAGDLSGITGMEFPLLNYAIYGVSTLFGYQHWYGRLINLIITSIGLLFFFRLIRILLDEKTAFWSTLILGSSIWYAFGRKIMPDTFACSIGIIAVYYGYNYLLNTKNKIRNLIIYGVLVGLSTLSKLPALVLFSFLVPAILNKNYELKAKTKIILTSIIPVFTATFWYFYWVPHLVEHYGFWHFFMGKSILKGANELVLDWQLASQNFYQYALGFSGFSLFLFGCYKISRNKNKLIIQAVVPAFLLFLVIIFKAGWTFAHHNYYMIPFVPFMALIAGDVLSRLNRNFQWVIILIVFAECLITAAPHFNIKSNYAAIENLEVVLDNYMSRNELIVINSSNNPTPMYFSHRKGWIANNDQLTLPSYQSQIIKKGCKYALILKKAFGTPIELPFEILLDSEDYTLYKLPSTAD